MKFLQTNVGVQSKVPSARTGAKARKAKIVKSGAVDSKKKAGRR